LRSASRHASNSCWGTIGRGIRRRMPPGTRGAAGRGRQPRPLRAGQPDQSPMCVRARRHPNRQLRPRCAVGSTHLVPIRPVGTIGRGGTGRISSKIITGSNAQEPRIFSVVKWGRDQRRSRGCVRHAEQRTPTGKGAHRACEPGCCLPRSVALTTKARASSDVVSQHASVRVAK
jgi:hypothetical protein